jgi:AcrR family transcriptional regulator
VRGRVGEDPATALREHLIEVAERLMAERPVSTVTTRDLARAAGVSDGVLYNYFADKNELLVAALVRRYARLLARFDADLPRPGAATVEENLLAYAQAALDLVGDSLPIAAGLIGEPAMLQRFLVEVHRHPFGPQRLVHPIADYLSGEPRLGQLTEEGVEAATTMLLGTTIMFAFTSLMAGTPREELVAQLPAIVRVIVRGLTATDGS